MDVGVWTGEEGGSLGLPIGPSQGIRLLMFRAPRTRIWLPFGSKLSRFKLRPDSFRVEPLNEIGKASELYWNLLYSQIPEWRRYESLHNDNREGFGRTG